MDEHIIEALGKSRIIVKNGKIVKIGDPLIHYCPLFEKYRGIKKLTHSTIEDNIQFRIEDFGMCTANRTLKMRDFLSFGISETLSTLIEDKIVDCAVIVCEGAGTVLITDHVLVQGIGGRISGFISTSPIAEIIDEIKIENVLDAKKAVINQVDGVLKAINSGYKKIAVTITSFEEAKHIRKIEKDYDDVKIYIFAVHTTGISKEDAEGLFKYCDIITACASKYLREIAEKKNIYSVGASIPIYGVTKNGKEFIKRRINKIGGLKEKKDAKIPDPLI
ncbi:MAG: methanogenesis marker 8 protein [Methanomicrobiales archaeon]